MEHGVFWACSQCGGRALNVELLRRTFRRASVNSFWTRVLGRQGGPGRICPSCRRAMLEVKLTDQPGTSRIDVCSLCHFVWFDAHEIGEMEPLDPGEEVSPEARQARAYVEIHRIAQAAKGRDLDGALVDAWWKKVIRALGFYLPG